MTPSVRKTQMPTASPTSGCTDDSTFEFELDIGTTVTCSWITTNVFKVQTRKNKYCPRAEIFTKCRSTCERCTCEDDDSFEFELNNENFRGCSWFLLKNTQIRRNRYCYDLVNGGGTFIADSCPKGCGYCS
jgi:hypothetical protein